MCIYIKYTFIGIFREIEREIDGLHTIFIGWDALRMHVKIKAIVEYSVQSARYLMLGKSSTDETPNCSMVKSHIKRIRKIPAK